MPTIIQVAKRQDGMSRRCGKCPIKALCFCDGTHSIFKVCSESFVEGFKKGYKYKKKKK